MQSTVEKDLFIDMKEVHTRLGKYYDGEKEIEKYLLAIKKGNIFVIGKTMQMVASVVGLNKGIQAHNDFVKNYNELVKSRETYYEQIKHEFQDACVRKHGVIQGVFFSSKFDKHFPLFIESELEQTFKAETGSHFGKVATKVDLTSESVLEQHIFDSLTGWFAVEAEVKRQVKIDGGRLDIVIGDFVNEKTYILELKKDVADLKAVEQILRYRKKSSYKDKLILMLVANGFTEDALKYSEKEDIKCLSYESYVNEKELLILFDEMTNNFDEHCPVVECLETDPLMSINYMCRNNPFPSIKDTEDDFFEMLSFVESEHKKTVEYQKGKIKISFGGGVYGVSKEEAVRICSQIESQMTDLQEGGQS